MWFRGLLLFVAFLTGSERSLAQQQQDRRSRDEPSIQIEAGGRVGYCDVLAFSADGRSLFAAGDDKVVRVWPYADGRLDTKRENARTLRWPAWREQRGGIKAMAVSPDGKRVAIGGYGLTPNAVAVLDRDTFEPISITFPDSRQGTSNFGGVSAIAFHTDGKRIGFGTLDGSLWSWDPTPLPVADMEGRSAAAPVCVGKHRPLILPGEAKTVAEFNRPRLIYYPDATKMVSIAESGEVRACDLKGPRTEQMLFEMNPDRDGQYDVFRADRTADGKSRAIATFGSQFFVLGNDPKENAFIRVPVTHSLRSIAVHPKTGQVAVGVRLPPAMLQKGAAAPFFMDQPEEIWLYDNPIGVKGNPEPVVRVPHSGSIEALAFHPTDNRLAVAGGDADEVALLDLDTPDKSKPVSTVQGTGRQLWGVKLSANGNAIGIQPVRNPNATDPNRRGDTRPESWAYFDLLKRETIAGGKREWIEAVSTADGWEIVPDETDRYVWYARLTQPDGTTTRHPLQLAPASDQAPVCFTFIPRSETKPTRVIVGHYDGCSLFELTPAGATRTRIYVGHSGEVTSVVAAKNQKWFVTAGRDHTVAAWSLEDWPSNPRLGAAFVQQAGLVKVAAVDPGSPAWEAGLAKDDVIDRLSIDGKVAFNRNAKFPIAGGPADALNALNDPSSGVELSFDLHTPNAVMRETLTTVRQRPLWKMFPTFHADKKLAEWTIWMWHGSFYDTSTHGDRLIGWHMNHPQILRGKPQYYPLERFKGHFYRPQVIDKLLLGRDVATTLSDASALGPNPVKKKFYLLEPAPVALRVTPTVQANGVAVAVTVRPRGDNPDLLPDRVELWLNDHRYRVWPNTDGPPWNPKTALEETILVKADAFRAGDSTIAVLSFNKAGGRSEAQATVWNPAPAAPRNLHGLAVGVNNYDPHRVGFGMWKAAAGRGGKAFGNLQFARDDARDFSDRMNAHRGPGKPFGGETKLIFRPDDLATKDAQLADLKRIAHVARPDDLLIVFFAGHGADPDDVLNTPRARGEVGRFVFCCPDFDPFRIDTTSVSAEELFEALAAVNCRKLVLLDACHSGGAANANLVRRFVPNGHGPMILAACTQRQQSLEHDQYGHGLFTYAILQALGDDFGFAAGADRVLTVQELFEYLRRRVPVLVQKLPPPKEGEPHPDQIPISFPPSLPAYELLRR